MCVIVFTQLKNGDLCIAKNRDRTYSPNITMVRELINGTEVAYLHDIDTDWSEGLNSNGVGIVNSALMVTDDENEKKNAKKTGQPSLDGFKIRTALGKDKLSDVVQSVVSFRGEDKYDVGVKGHTFISTPSHAFSIEMTRKHVPIIKKLNLNKTYTRTNHGFAYPDAGYQTGPDHTSTKLRKLIGNKEARVANTEDELLDNLSKNYSNIPNWAQPYRDTNKLSTTSQICMNLDKKLFLLKLDKEKSNWNGIINKLPKWYTPKIKIRVEYSSWNG